MDIKRVVIKSLHNGRLVINFPDIPYKMVLEKAGQQKAMPYDVFEIGRWNDGFIYMVKQGMIEIVNQDQLEDFEYKTTNNFNEVDEEKEMVYVLNDVQKKRCMTVMPIGELKTTLSKLTAEQLKSLADFAIENDYSDYQRCELLKKCTGIDIPKAISFKHQMEG